MTEELLEKLKEKYTFTPCEAEEYEAFSLAGMDFTAKGWDAEGLGRISLMQAEGMGGAMKMESLIVNPLLVDAPLFNLDVIFAQGRIMFYGELYDTLVAAERQEDRFRKAKEAFPDLMDLPGKPAWYDDLRYGCSLTKAGADAQKDRFEELAGMIGNAYLDMLSEAEACDPAAKKEKADAYRDGLLANGGPATDAFLKVWGPEKTGVFFREVLFG